MNACWRNPCNKITEDILVGNTTFRISGLYNDGEGETPLSGGGATAPVKPSFEIENISMLIDTPQGGMAFNITNLLEDVNSITWRKDARNDLFEYFSDKMIDICSDGA